LKNHWISNLKYRWISNLKIVEFWIWSLKIAEFRIWNLKITKFWIWKIAEFSKFQMLNLKNRWISNLENCQIFKISNWTTEKKNWTTKKPAKAPPRVLSELNYRKTTFLKVSEKKQGLLVWFLSFSKAKALKKLNQTHPKSTSFWFYYNITVSKDVNCQALSIYQKKKGVKSLWDAINCLHVFYVGHAIFTWI
jgi:hypothetical protein